MSQMKEACDELLNLLQKSEAVLDHATRRMEEEFADRFDQTGANPMALMKRIHKLQRELPDLKEQCDQMIKAKQELMEVAREQLGANKDALQQLAVRSGLPRLPAASQESYAELEKAVGQWSAQVAPQAAEAQAAH